VTRKGGGVRVQGGQPVSFCRPQNFGSNVKEKIYGFNNKPKENLGKKICAIK